MEHNIADRGIILIVDDNPTNLELLIDSFQDVGLKPLVARDGPSALQRLEHASPDLILLDVVMPGIGGFDLCRQLKENPTTRDIPVIFMTALNDTSHKVKGFQAGAVDYVSKPFQQEELLARVRTHLALRRLQKRLEDQNQVLAGTVTQLEEANGELDAFAQTVAHELKNPLSMIMGHSGLLIIDENLSEEGRRSLEVISRASKDMALIINELLLLAGMRKSEVEMSPLMMDKIIEKAMESLAYLIKEHQAEITYPQEWSQALGHAPLIEQVWVNYMSNAIKYGGKPPRLELGVDTDTDDMIRFWVQDNGDGLTPEQQAHLFIPFTKLHQVNVDGHGLGLSICQRIVEKMRGLVGVESQPGQGSRFYFTLPRDNRVSG